MKIGRAISGLWKANTDHFKKEISKRKINVQTKYDYSELYNIVHNESQPCFVLSTGRCGTALLTKIFEEHSEIDVHHTPKPELVYYSKFAYENSKSHSNEIKHLVDAARYEQIKNAFLLEKTFVETNNRVTFFASQLADLYSNAKFIHLIRNPINFIKSGIARDWYTGKNPHDEGHIILNDNPEIWEKYSQEEKIAWMWNETNQFIEDFKTQIEPKRVLTIFAEDLFNSTKTAGDLFKFINVPSISDEKLNYLARKPVNKSNVKKIKSIDIDFTAELNSILSLKERYKYL